ncbi:MAG: hypothetical protein GX410_09650 [Elusimicrobia bacterium]|nr:hypothetical protein [Elusimicrobiota bacterium]
MPRVLFLNLDELLHDSKVEALLSYYPQRYLLRANPGDIVVVPDPVDADFVAYARSVKKLAAPENWLVVTGRNSGALCSSRSLFESGAPLARLKKLVKKGGYVFTPYLQTPKMLDVAQKLGLRPEAPAMSLPDAVNSGLTLALNNKLYFKRLCRRNGVPVLPDYVCTTPEAITAAAEKLGRGGRRVILKKTRAAGGYGNISGTAAELAANIALWRKWDEVLVEPHLGDERVVGALALLDADGVKFLGLDRQDCVNDAWNGCEFPYSGRGAAEVKRHTLRLARLLWKEGLRGEMDLDWFATPRNGVFAIECNFRDNGFGYILELARDAFGLPPARTHARYWAALKLGQPSLRLIAEKISALNAGTRRGGAILCGKPKNGRVGVLAAADSAAALRRLSRAIIKELS